MFRNKRKIKSVIKPRLGQHFLLDETTLNKIVDAAEVARSDVVLEIGPGKGSLTGKLAMRCRKVIAVELDRQLVQLLRVKLKHFRNLTVIQDDILAFSAHGLHIAGYKVVGNIPYYISGKILRAFTENKNRPKMAVFLVQKEVAERVCSCPGKMSILAVAVQIFGEPEIIAYVPREKFTPAPAVDSAILRIRMKPYSAIEQAFGKFDYKGRLKTSTEEINKINQDFFHLVKIGFASPRKQIHNNLRNGFHLDQVETGMWLKAAGIKRAARPQELSVEEWIRLLEVLQ